MFNIMGGLKVSGLPEYTVHYAPRILALAAAVYVILWLKQGGKPLNYNDININITLRPARDLYQIEGLPVMTFSTPDVPYLKTKTLPTDSLSDRKAIGK